MARTHRYHLLYALAVLILLALAFLIDLWAGVAGLLAVLVTLSRPSAMLLVANSADVR